jgi:hypothetical protein
MDNVGIVVESLDGAISFFAELGLEVEGRATIERDWAERVTGLRHMRVEIAMMRTPDGHSRLEISRFLTPPAVADHRSRVGYCGSHLVKSPARSSPRALARTPETAIAAGETTSRLRQRGRDLDA